MYTEQRMGTPRSVDTDIKIKENFSVSDQVSSELTETKIDYATESATDEKGKLMNESTPPSGKTTPSITCNETTSTEDETLEDSKQDYDDDDSNELSITDNNVQIVSIDTSEQTQ